MLIRLQDVQPGIDRLLEPTTGTLILVDRVRRSVEWVHVESRMGDEAVATIGALDEILASQDAETSGLRFWLTQKGGTMDLLEGEPRMDAS